MYSKQEKVHKISHFRGNTPMFCVVKSCYSRVFLLLSLRIQIEEASGTKAGFSKVRTTSKLVLDCSGELQLPMV